MLGLGSSPFQAPSETEGLEFRFFSEFLEKNFEKWKY